MVEWERATMTDKRETPRAFVAFPDDWDELSEDERKQAALAMADRLCEMFQVEPHIAEPLDPDHQALIAESLDAERASSGSADPSC